ncbi:site-specific integrase [Caballeronia sp. GAWG1-1]|uniref:tyrosine-type recombinase/integrase n=1 Tax=Caballeronia sp. GAWG1-1 TaxID=2921742 RepID=UPI0020289115|nr:site-specific integrase [Caballeronia sp. GAWG1-1]
MAGRLKGNPLTDLEIRQFVAAGIAGARSDGAGLTLTLSKAGTAAWILRFSHGGKQQEMTLGRYPDIKLATARKMASEKRVEVQQGINPALAARKAKSVVDWNVRQLVADYRDRVLAHLADSTQRSYGRNLTRIENALGSMPIRAVEPAEIVAMIERARLGWVEANTLLIVTKAIYRHAAGKKLVSANPVVGIELSAIVGKRPPKRTRLMLSAEEIREVTNAKMNDANRLSACILLATGVRASELFTSVRKDVYLDESRWHIPKSKTGPEMDIPLAPSVVQWFRELFVVGGESKYSVPARLRTRIERLGGDANVSKDALREAIDFWIENADPTPKIRRFTPHDLRSTMKSHMRRLGVSRDISEMCLNHALPGVEGVYDQYHYWDERRAALELWAAFIESCRTGAEWNVTPLHRTAA